MEITGEAFDAGVGILVGTDGGDSFVYPGFAVHDELEELVAAGLMPIEALRAAILRSAEFLGLEDRFGAIERGMTADFLLMDSNPLDDIGHTKEIWGLIFRGGTLTEKHWIRCWKRSDCSNLVVRALICYPTSDVSIYPLKSLRYTVVPPSSLSSNQSTRPVPEKKKLKPTIFPIRLALSIRYTVSPFKWMTALVS